MRVNVSGRVLTGLDDAKWDTMITEVTDVASWDGPVVVVRASSG